MKTRQMTLDDDLVKEVDLLAKELNTTRSALRWVRSEWVDKGYQDEAP